MKKLILMTAAVATIFASCSKGQDPIEKADKVLTVSIANVEPTSRAIGAPTPITGVVIADGDGIIFITDASGTVKRAIPFAANFPATQTSQTVTGVTSTDKVFVLANIGSSNVTDWTTTLLPANVTAIKNLYMSITDPITRQIYSNATLSNADGNAMALTVNGNDASALVVINPAYSRLEVKNIVGSQNITGFTVAGVYVDEYYPEYTIGGSFHGTKYNQLQSTTFSGIPQMHDEGSWPATTNIATPNTTDAWVYSVPAGNVPRFIIRLTNVTGTFNGGNSIDSGAEYFLTVGSYSSFTDINFLRGKVYHIENLTFNQDNLHLAPNPITVDLTVTLSITQWVIANIGANLQ